MIRKTVNGTVVVVVKAVAVIAVVVVETVAVEAVGVFVDLILKNN